MPTKHLNLFNPQWQGGGQDMSTYYGGQELKHIYLQNVPFSELAVSTEPISAEKNRILAYDDLYDQLAAARELLEHEQPNTIFTVGGGCDADLMCMSYLAQHSGDLTVLYFDAHGDLNTPAESSSRLFYGMPVRTLLGEGDADFISLLPATIQPKQLIQIGGRALDHAEERFIKKNGVPVFSPGRIDMNRIFDAIDASGGKRLYLHIDLDVLDPEAFPYVPVPEPKGVAQETLLNLLTALSERYEVCGLGLLEYNGANQRLPLIEHIMKLGFELGGKTR